jgi:nicotinamide-nucleotide amidase
MRVEVLNTGSELLLGTTLNTHGAWIGRALQPLGLRVARQTTVPDGAAIGEALAEAVGRGGVVVVTGGLGPTSDDVTREACAGVLGVELTEDAGSMRAIEEFFRARGREMAPENRKQSLVPHGGVALPNPNGTAPGVFVPEGAGGAAVFLLPGPPHEMEPMFRAEVLPRLREWAGAGEAAGMTELKFVGVGESAFQRRVDAELAAVPGLEFGYCARPGEVDLRLIGNDEARAAGRAIAGREFPRQLASDDGSSLEAAVVRGLLERGWTLATAESCTGGLIASRLTDVPGASAVFTHGFVTYANEAKVSLLGVPEELLAVRGAVSEPVARAMAEGALRASGADVAVAVTGIAGPDGGTPEKPVGTVFLALARNDEPTEVRKRFHPQGRAFFKRQVSQDALDWVRRVV